MKKSVRFFTLVLLVLVGFSPLLPRETTNKNDTTLKVEFSIDSIQHIILHPEEILKDIDRFWKTDEAYQLSSSWHRNNNIPVKIDRFRENIVRVSQIPSVQRDSNPHLKLARSIESEEARFINIAIPHILSFLPRNGLQMETKIHLTAFTTAYAFMTNTQIVADITSPKLFGTVNSILNIILHEVYHIGYGINRLLRSEEPLEDSQKYFVLDVLHNEGMATYVAWKAREIYPFQELDDYRMLGESDMVREKIKKVNEIFSKIDKLPREAFSKLSWEEGVRNRAYYIAGAHMSRTIDKKKGRESLIEAIEKGPRYFVSLYNTVADGDMKVTEFDPPRGISVYTRIFHFLMENPGSDLSPFDRKLEALSKKDSKSLASRMNFLGYKLLYRDRITDAICVLKRAIFFFPEDANLFDTLGEVYMKSGDREKAIENYRKSLELDPDNTNAKKYLEILQGETRLP